MPNDIEEDVSDEEFENAEVYFQGVKEKPENLPADSKAHKYMGGN